MVTELLIPTPRVVVPKPPSWLRGDWRFSEGSGLYLGDLSRYRNGGTIDGATWSTDRKPGCLDFNGTSNKVSCGAGASFDITGDITLEAVFKLDVLGVYHTLIGKGTNTAYSLQVPVSNAGQLLLWIDGAWRSVSTGALSADTWYHLVGTYDISIRTLKIFLNGGYVTQTVLSGLADYSISTTTAQLTIGYSWGVRYLNGLINLVRILSIPLSASEVLARYNATR